MIDKPTVKRVNAAQLSVYLALNSLVECQMVNKRLQNLYNISSVNGIGFRGQLKNVRIDKPDNILR